MKLVENYIKGYDEVLTDEECKNFITKIDQETLLQIIDETHAYRAKSVHGLPNWTEDDTLLSSIAFHLAQEYFNEVEVPLIPQIEGFEAVHVIKMQDKDYIDVHVDVNSQSSAKRYLTVMIFFNEFNGQILFPTIEKSVRPKAGSVLIFPPTWMFPFAIEHTKGSTNHFAITYLHYINK
jgi:hypothetical protein